MTERLARRRKKSGGKTHGHQPNAASKKRQQEFIERVTGLADPLCSAEGVELVHVDFQREPGGLTLRLYIDRPGGITLDDCVEISRQLDDLLDVHIKDIPPYRLEVSSPGVDRPVGKLQDFIRFQGHRASIRIAEPIDGRKNFTGVLHGVVDNMVRIQLQDKMVNLDFENITRARLINYNGEH